MHTIENKEIEIQGQKQNYKDLILACITTTPQDGFTHELNKKIERIEDVVSENKTKYDVEDSDTMFIKEKVGVMAWAIYDRQLTQFQDYIKGLTPNK